MKDIKEVKDYQIVVLGLLIALGAIISTYILSNAVISYQKMNTQALSVTGSASQEIKSLKKKAKKMAGFDHPVYIYGESGTGKELLSNEAVKRAYLG